jgi:hypothetical protein
VSRLEFAECAVLIYNGNRGCTIEHVGGKHVTLSNRDEIRKLALALLDIAGKVERVRGPVVVGDFLEPGP